MSPPEDHLADLPDERAQPGQSVGSTLRAARLRLGQDLSEVAAVLRIRSPFLQAIEDGQFATLPGLPYAIGFVRTYADHLGLDGAEMVRRFKSEAAGLERKTNLSFPSPAPEGRVPGTAALLISLVAATLVFGGWYLYQNGGERLAMRVPEVPERLANPPPVLPPGATASGPGETPAEAPAAAAAVPAAPSPSPGASPTSGGSPAAVVASTAPPSSAAPAPVAGAPRPAPLTVEPALPPPPGDPTRRLAAAAPPGPLTAPVAAPMAPAPAGAAPETEDSPPPDPTSLSAAPAAGPAGIPPVPQVAAAVPDGRVFGAQNGDSRVVIKAHGESWVQVRDAANTPLLTRVLRPGDSYRVPNQPGLTMMTGNAGVLDVFVDGNAAPSLGGVGVVRRNIALDADRLRTGAAGAQ
jgi:cytoskeleton protein RodZ